MPQTVHGEPSKDIAIGIAVTSVILAGSIHLPILGIICTLFIPLPILFYRSKLGRANAVIIPAAATLVMVAMLRGMSISAIFLMELMLLGFVLSELIELDLSIEKTVTLACCSVLVTGFVAIVLYGNVSGIRIIDSVSDSIEKILIAMISLYEKNGASEANLYLLSTSLKDIQFYLVRIIPALIVVQTIVVAWTNLLMARPMFKAKALFYPNFGALNLWKAPEFLVWCVIASGLMVLLPGRAFKVLGINGLIILMAVYFFQGIAVVSYYFEEKRIPVIFKVFFYCLIALQQFILFLVVGLGFFDIWLNFRKLKT